MPSPNLRRKPTGTIDPINVPAPTLQRGPSPTPTSAAVASADPKSSGPSAPPNVPKIPLIQEIKDFLATAEGGKVEEGLDGLDGEKIKLSYIDGGVITQCPSFQHKAIAPILMAARGWGELSESLIKSCGVPTIHLFDGEEYKVPDYVLYENTVPGSSSGEPTIILKIAVAQSCASVNYVTVKSLTGSYSSVHLVITVNINLTTLPNDQRLKNQKGEVIKVKKLKELSVESWASVVHDSLLLENEEGNALSPQHLLEFKH
ncbi:unnamed protein product [Cyclocybe aegerita]|uniref:Uncharacterized protein n=1 Tax=Cyclocybe aegerita TaxID=1973307 RepID=A0A8S0WFH9_CYCAE|nr:unnamed protein product [Cyclocybe aegerita]